MQFTVRSQTPRRTRFADPETLEENTQESMYSGWMVSWDGQAQHVSHDGPLIKYHETFSNVENEINHIISYLYSSCFRRYPSLILFFPEKWMTHGFLKLIGLGKPGCPQPFGIRSRPRSRCNSASRPFRVHRERKIPTTLWLWSK